MNKINRVLQQWPQGAVVPPAWLEEFGLSRRDAAKHAQHGNLLRIGVGAYARPGDNLRWEGGVYGLQYGAKTPALPFWPGGLTALSLAGYSHYVIFGRDQLQLFGKTRVRLNKWFGEHDWGVELELNPGTLFQHDDDKIFETYTPPGRTWHIHISSPEMAILELLYITPDELLFSDRLVNTFNGLTNLRPRRLQRLLEACTSVKVKRVFLLLARNIGYGWYARLDKTRIDLGKGKRQLTQGGKLDMEYQLVVPEGYARGV